MGMVADGGGGAATKGFPGGWSVVAKPCDYCKSAAALLFCRADSAFMCAACDAKVHDATNKLTSRHERVWMCEVCEQAPAIVTCKADAAALCVTCDRDIHSANPLAQRHERIPVVPFYDTAESVVKSTASTLLVSSTHSNNMAMATPSTQVQDTKIGLCPTPGNYGTDSWISSNPINSKYIAETPDLKSSMEFLLSDSDHFLDFDYPVSKDNYYNSGSDSVVPVQTMKPPPMPTRVVVDHPSETRFEIDFTRSSINSYNNNSYTAQSLSHSVSSSSLEVGIVPDGSSISETSYPFGRSMTSGVDLSGTASGDQAFPMVGKDREARVLRYREKRKNRKFEKTIRYASRKAYAETRPRVKGRFAKRSSTEIECEIDQMFSSGSTGFSFSDARYGVVPSF